MVRMANKDYKLLQGIREKIKDLSDVYLKELSLDSAIIFEYPLDKDVISALTAITLKGSDEDYQIFQFLKEINILWKLIIEKSIKCLRYFDIREPFLKNKSKKPIAYGVSELGEYFDKYSEFESMLYGGVKYYRDHVVHVFRTWLLGMDCMLENDGEYLQNISIGKNIKTNQFEKLSIWSIIALTHDLGYPLEKSQEIIDKTRDMMKSFIENPIISVDLSFNGVQNNMNDFVVRFLSSKMHEQLNYGSVEKVNSEGESALKNETKAPKRYVARLQPKYYFKFQKSLEKSMHGILSSIIIYKLLIYFLESDYSINEDYIFYEEDVRQFYIRREILRAIAAHTCHDIYHLDMLSFTFLLIVVDDSQSWGRKKISELYVKSNTQYEFKEIKPIFNVKSIDIDGDSVQLHKCTVSEQFTLPKEEINGLKRLLLDLKKQCEDYKEIFRDGQDTAKRNFTFIKKCKLIYEEEKSITFDIEFTISNDEKSSFSITVEKTGNIKLNKKFDLTFMPGIYKDAYYVIERVESDDNIQFIVQDKNVWN